MKINIQSLKRTNNKSQYINSVLCSFIDVLTAYDKEGKQNNERLLNMIDDYLRDIIQEAKEEGYDEGYQQGWYDKENE